MMRSLFRQDRGATAIEYAIIAGLIGLGIVGSLVTTKGSLNAVFGTTATKMVGTPATTERPAPAASTSTRAPFWNAKTLSATTATQPDPQTKVNTFTYADGASATLTRKYDANGVFTGETLAVNRPALSAGYVDSVVWTFDATGKGLTQDYYLYYGAGGPVQVWSQQTAASGYAVNEVWYNSNGSVQRTYSYPVGAFPDLDAKAYADEIYFRGLASQ